MMLQPRLRFPSSLSLRLPRTIACNRPVQILTAGILPHPKGAGHSHFSIAAFCGKTPPKIVKSPAATLLPRLSQREKDELAYPPDALPGGRDVDTPYGAIKVYEWGPEDGKKVLLIHGLTTSSIAVGAIASELVKRGYRVMTFDLWGHGYTDSCADLDYDIRLYTSQLLLAITSSKLSWTGATGFGLVGCSLGGAIAASFAGYFPQMVNSLAFLVPAGLIRKERLAAQMRLLELGSLLIPSRILEKLIMKRLTQPLFEDNRDNSSSVGGDVERKPCQREAQASLRYPHVTVSETMRWTMQNHKGFYTSFMSTAKHMHGTGQLERWRLLRDRPNKTLIIAGSNDPIIVADELHEDAVEALGDNLDWRVLEGAHDITIARPKEIADAIFDSWQLEDMPIKPDSVMTKDRCDT
ncbi:alpha/beta-hydrolase [Cadophora sp. DSE1049]|nr:alpha/beta-hydrolase [Cadophora sp. DSE1049]